MRSLGRGRLGERNGAGWTFHDLLAHVAAWESLAARRLHRLATDGFESEPVAAADVDAFNARVITEHRLVGPEALLDELDASHGRLLDAIGALQDAQIQAHAAWVERVVSKSTYLHYAEHLCELRPAPLKAG